MGISYTKTLAKVASRFGKKYKGYEGVCIIDSEEKREKALRQTDIGDVWGIGFRNRKKLNYYASVQHGILHRNLKDGSDRFLQ